MSCVIFDQNGVLAQCATTLSYFFGDATLPAQAQCFIVAGLARLPFNPLLACASQSMVVGSNQPAPPQMRGLVDGPLENLFL